MHSLNSSQIILFNQNSLIQNLIPIQKVIKSGNSLVEDEEEGRGGKGERSL